ncbi:putative glucuronidase [Leeuwenhoekiella aestuarii]|uniref:Putative glucuronidase n=2 Tax=Leeuwenhoekiella aestuarii TaxID=2249426 RepID=A0A4Q0NSG5_9FLAO|nr:putative glucuronidase [Leeuwenhoekiella aestuarii]RXG15109.1 putative glucuronidase [Leeuwenhoekiella aestuarii]
MKLNLLSYIAFFFCIFQFNTICSQTPNRFKLVTDSQQVSILYDKDGVALDSIAAHLLAKDIERVTGYLPQVTTDKTSISGNAIVIGNQASELIQSFSGAKNSMQDAWETYTLQLVKPKNSPIANALIIAGADARGTAYGVFNISDKIGVSPWYWWADVVPAKQKELALEISSFQSISPKVKYRGIFLNDEDWGLQPWAEHTFEPETGDIGPKTYAKIFELLLRLKANAIWPAMHPSTKAFFHYPGNLKMAENYEIVLGSSHAEPMLRNNVDEWDHDTMGDFNYFSNKEKVLKYWENRVEEAQNANGIYTVGMRGVHDSGMVGAKSTEDAATILNELIKDQRALLKKHIGNPESIPQVFTVYKEVLDVYEYGLELPEDITLMWTDDNYGYIRRLSNAEERKRKGGSGVYYHASYWGRPHDYLWLSTTHPALIREEMLKAYDTGADKIWMLNVGDLKPAEYNTQFFMDLAFDPESFRKPDSYKQHMTDFYERIFGSDVGAEISNLRESYYDLAWLRKPEFMGWSQTEPTRPTHLTEFSLDQENPDRRAAYQKLESKVEQLNAQVPNTQKAAWFELVAYPVLGASAMNQKYLYRDLASFYADQDPERSKSYQDTIALQQDKIKELTTHYNTEIAEGKWNKMMHSAPRGLPVYQVPEAVLPEEKAIQKYTAPVLAQKMASFTKTGHFEKNFPLELTGLGYSQRALQLTPVTQESYSDSAFAQNPVLHYELDLEEKIASAVLTLTAVPNHPITGDQKLRLGVQWDDQPVEIVNFETHGRSETWKINVLRNQVRTSVTLKNLEPGKHQLKLYVIDPGVLPDYFLLSKEKEAIPYTFPKNQK